ncbi:MAG: ABC transporter substrate-binding protein [Bacteroidia bacterium]
MKQYFYFFLLFLIASCSSPQQELYKNVFRMNLEEGLSTLDPAFARDQRAIWMTSQIFSGLIELDTNLQARGLLAKSWEISPDGKIYTFHLRSDVNFQKHACFGKDSTRKVTAQDFVYSFSRICDAKVASNGFWIFNNKIKGAKEFNEEKATEVTGFQALNDSTFQIELTQAFPPFLNLLAMPYAFVVPKEAVSLYQKEFGRNPVGCGAFCFFKWEEGNYLLLHKNKHYFEKKAGQQLPLLDAVKVSFIPSKLSAFIQFKQGNLDFMNDIHLSYKDEVLTNQGKIQPQYAEKYQFLTSPQLILYYVGMMTDPSKYPQGKHPLLNVKVRQALSHAIDRKKMTTYLLNGMGYPSQRILPQILLPAQTDTTVGYEYNLDKAKALLAEAGYPNGQGLGEWELSIAADYAFLGEFIQKEVEPLGVKLRVKTAQAGAVRKDIMEGKLAIWRANWIGDYPDGETFLSLFHSKNHAPSGPNTTHYGSETFDKLYEQAMTLQQDSLRKALYVNMEKEVLANAPIIPLYHGRIFRITQKNIKNLPIDAMNQLSLKYVKKEIAKNAISPDNTRPSAPPFHFFDN